METESILGYALLGLIHQQPMSGYDLRKLFATTAMGSYSDSPGAIYPALRRLEARGMAASTVEEPSSLRPRRVYRATPAGIEAFRAWMHKPVTRDDVMRGIPGLILRFAFMDDAAGPARAASFLREVANQIEAYLPELRQFLGSHAAEMPLSGRLALECGIEEYEMRLGWARRSISLYEKERGQSK
ncbi:MAG: PadR family transcriptional regulator [Terracidiphilus sp.]